MIFYVAIGKKYMHNWFNVVYHVLGSFKFSTHCVNYLPLGWQLSSRTSTFSYETSAYSFGLAAIKLLNFLKNHNGNLVSCVNFWFNYLFFSKKIKKSSLGLDSIRQFSNVESVRIRCFPIRMINVEWLLSMATGVLKFM